MRGKQKTEFVDSPGIVLQHDPLNTPEGAMTQAENVLCAREGVVAESRRGLERYGAAAGAEIRRLMEFQNRLQRHSGTVLEYDDGAGNWTAYSTPITAPDPGTGTRVRNQEQRESNFLTTDAGVFKQTSISDEPSRAGIPIGLAPRVQESTPSPGSVGSVAAGDLVAYKVVYGRYDENEEVQLGAPSDAVELVNEFNEATWSRVGGGSSTVANIELGYTHFLVAGNFVTVRNSSSPELDGTWSVVSAPTQTSVQIDITPETVSSNSGTCEAAFSVDVNLLIPLPAGMVAGEYAAIYRSEPALVEQAVANAEFFRVALYELTAADVAQGFWIYVGQPSDEFLDDPLYSNPSNGALSRLNLEPPWAKDLVLFKGHMIYGNCRREEVIDLRIVDIAALDGESITIGSEVYSFSLAAAWEDPALLRVQLFDDSATLAEDLRRTAESWIWVVNAGSASYYARNISGVNDAPGKVGFFSRTVNAPKFDLVASTEAAGFGVEPRIPTTAGVIQSETVGGVNRVYISKHLQPEAVPSLSFRDVGEDDDPIERMVNVGGDAVLIYKRYGGLYALTGETDGATGQNFVVKLRDVSLRLLAPDTVAVLDDQSIALSTRGFVANSAIGGTQIIGRQVETGVIALSTNPSFFSECHAVSYPSDHLYICFTPENLVDADTPRGWTYNSILGTWTVGWQKDVSAGHVLSEDDKLYLAHRTDQFVLQERKTYSPSLSDFADETIAVTVTEVLSTTSCRIQYTYTGRELSPGFLLQQGVEEALLDSVVSEGSDIYLVTLEKTMLELQVAAANVVIPIATELRFHPFTGKSAADLKQFSDLQIEFGADEAFKHFVGFESDYLASPKFNDSDDGYLIEREALGWGSSWGAPWGDGELPKITPLTCPVPWEYQRSRRLKLLYRHARVKERVSISQITVYFRTVGRRSARRRPVA